MTIYEVKSDLKMLAQKKSAQFFENFPPAGLDL